MKIRVLLAILFITTAALMPGKTASAEEPPQHTFRGKVTMQGKPVGDGTHVTMMGRSIREPLTTQTSEGQYVLQVPPGVRGQVEILVGKRYITYLDIETTEGGNTQENLEADWQHHTWSVGKWGYVIDEKGCYLSLDFIGYAKRSNHGKYEVETIYPRPGPTGLEGKPGEAGRDGPQGKPGAQGDRGKQGTEGEPGPKGKPGRAGHPGIGGEPGPEGEMGPAGNTGRETIAIATAAGTLAIVIGHHLIIQRRKPYKSLALAAMIGLLALPTQQAHAQAELDHLFTGRVTTHDEIVASNGATITAFILGKETGKAIVKDGRYKISTRGRTEEEITFFLNGIPTAQSHIWSQGGNTELDLTRVDYVEAGKYLHEKAGCHGTINKRGLTIYMNKEHVPAISRDGTRPHMGAPRGIRGPRGKQGTQGEPGPNGEKGPEGSTGTQGKPGPQGPPGKAGPHGAVGSRGEKGPEGTTGLPETQGGYVVATIISGAAMILSGFNWRESRRRRTR